MHSDEMKVHVSRNKNVARENGLMLYKLVLRFNSMRWHFISIFYLPKLISLQKIRYKEYPPDKENLRKKLLGNQASNLRVLAEARGWFRY